MHLARSALSLSIAAPFTVLALSCVSGTHPDDMSAAEHRSHAAEHDDEAAHHLSQYDPSAAPEPDYRQSPTLWHLKIYNPTEVHLEHARQHRDHAEDHRAAAAALEQYEDAECKSFPPQTRKLCPLVGTVEAIEDIAGGVRVQLAKEVNAEAALAHARCHLAYARTQHGQGMDRCPLYLQGVAATASADDHSIELTTEAADGVAALRQRARDHAAP